jgi:energy-coupling factor transport system substrate-specific component
MSTTSNSTSVTGATEPTPAAPTRQWRTVDAVVAAVLGVAFGVVFAGWNALWNALQPAFVGFPPAQGIMYGLWMLPGVLGMLVIRKPGAALFTELVASLVSMLFGGWGLTILIWGFFEGLAPELVFAAFVYRRFAVHVAALAGAAAGLIAGILDTVYYYPEWAFGWKLVYGILLVVSSAVIAGLGAVALVKSLRRTGVLSPFASGRG